VAKLAEYNENLKKEVGRLQKELLPYQLQKLKENAIEISGIKIIHKAYSDYDFKSLNDMAMSITKAFKSIVLFYIEDKLIIAVSDGIKYNASYLAKLFIEHFGGRGGGNPVIAQVGGFPVENIDSKMEEFTELIRKEFNRE
jgi:alanyl-tRNA synthetase